MLNYIWSGMIVIGIVSALFTDMRAELNDQYRNSKEYIANFKPVAQIEELKNQQIIIFSEKFEKEFLLQKKLPFTVKIQISQSAPEFWQYAISAADNTNNKTIEITVNRIDKEKKLLYYQLPEVHWLKINALTKAAFDVAGLAVKLAIGLIGIMALWLGLMRIAEKSGLIQYFVRLIYPLLHWLFPAIDKNHPVFGSISLNMAANVLGLGNAATPMGIKAMQQLQELNTSKEKASDEMCMFLAINTSSVQLLPPVTLIALIGPSVSELMLPIIFATSVSTITAIGAAKYFARRRAANATH